MGLAVHGLGFFLQFSQLMVASQQKPFLFLMLSFLCKLLIKGEMLIGGQLFGDGSVGFGFFWITGLVDPG
jgi:hypothetical protein